MLFSLTNLPKRSLRDEDGALAVVPRLLKGRTAAGLVRQAIEHMEGSLGVPRGEFDARALEAIMGNYRIARCIEACLMTHYSFKQPVIESLLSPEELEVLGERGLADPSSLRLALWDYANRAQGGFAPVGEREEVLARFAEECGLTPDAQLTDKLLTLDREEVATLEREGERPSPGEVILQYNRGAVRTLLAHAARVVFSLRQVPGATLKRTYFVAKRRGVYVDIEREAGGYTVLLHGPESATGGADRYGARLADVSLSLLRSLLGEVGGEAFGGATAYLVMHDREYRFHLTPELLARLEYEPKAEAETKHRVAEQGVAYSVGGAVAVEREAGGDEPLFDSLVEAKLYREFKSLERQGYTNGWQLFREPDPLLVPSAVMIPDFAFRRGEACVYMEIVGFWSPGYREKKLQKLRLLSGSSPDPRRATGERGGIRRPALPRRAVQDGCALDRPPCPAQYALWRPREPGGRRDGEVR
jgi:predicted nuclease of restriction endonuclease-like RecB superfamily